MSPSRAIERWIVEGATCPRAQLRRRIEAGLVEASERARERFGFACTAAAEVVMRLQAACPDGADPDEPATVERVRRAPAARAYRAPERLQGHLDVVVIGGGQAGLTVSWFLREHGIEHIVLERDTLASSWRNQRWDSFCLVTPNFQCRLPGHDYRGDDPDGFMLRDEIIEHVQAFATSFDPPLCEGVSVTEVASDGDAGFVVRTGHGDLHAGQVVFCVGRISPAHSVTAG